MSLIRYENVELAIRDLLQGDVQLASPPEIYARVRKLLDSPESTIGMLAEVIEHDPALTARILKLANSAFFALPQKVGNIAEAISIIGIRDVQDIVLATEVIQRFDNIPAELVDIYSYWRDSLRCAVLSRQMTQLLPQQHKSDSLFLAGLLHGIGHLVIYGRIPELGRKALLEHRHRGIPLHQAQREIMGFDYAAVGAALGREWALPEMLCSVMANHIQPELAEAFRTETAVVALANTISESGGFEQQAIDTLLPGDSPLWQESGINSDDLKTLLPEAANAFGAALALLR